MARLTKAARAKLPASAFAGPHRSYPMPDKRHAVVAIGLAKMHHSPKLGSIKAMARAKFGVGKAK